MGQTVSSLSFYLFFIFIMNIGYILIWFDLIVIWNLISIWFTQKLAIGHQIYGVVHLFLWISMWYRLACSSGHIVLWLCHIFVHRFWDDSANDFRQMVLSIQEIFERYIFFSNHFWYVLNHLNDFWWTHQHVLGWWSLSFSCLVSLDQIWYRNESEGYEVSLKWKNNFYHFYSIH